MHHAPDAPTSDAASPDELQHKLCMGRPEFGDALDGLKARMLAAAGGLAPRTIGRYRLGPVIGSGAFGTVYEADDPELDRRVAIKVLEVRSAAEAARVAREARLLATLSHPNVVQVFEVGTTDGGRSPYVVMELVEGSTLRRWLGEGEHGWREVVEMMLGAARGLWAAHQAGVIHRDLKPENVLVGHDGRPRVIDFGLARSIDDEGSRSDASTLRSGAHEPHRSGSAGTVQLTATGQVMGTPAYMAPEVFAGEHTPWSDQYALCVTLYEALYGARPFTAESPAELGKKVIAREARLPADRRGVPSRVGAIVLRGLRRRPRERFADLGELAAALDGVRRPRRWWPAALAGLAVLGAGGVAGGVLLAKSGRAEPIASEAARAEHEPTLDPQQAAAVAELASETERLRALVATAELDDALSLSLSLLARAEDLGHAPTLAEISLLRGRTLSLATDYAHAIPVLERAYLLAQEQGMPTVAAHAASELVGALGYHTDSYAQAHRWKDHADGAFRRAGLDPRRHAPYVFGVAGLVSREGDPAGAVALLRDAIAVLERDGRARTSDHALLLKTLGRELAATGDLEAALAPARDAVEIYAEHDGRRSLTHAAAQGNLGVFLSRLGRDEEALVHHREALEIRKAVLRPEHVDLGGSYLNMGMVLGNLGRHEEAFDHLDRALELFTARLGPGNGTVAEAYALRAAIHESRGPKGREDALRDHERAARIFDGAGVIYVGKAQSAREAIRRLGGTPPPAPSIPIPP